jgi:OHCU decarboxylase
MLTLEQVNRIDRAAFTAAFGAVFEQSPWVAERAWEARPFATRTALHEAMVKVVDLSGEDAQLALVRAHPDLGRRLGRASELSAHSAQEQAGAGLDRLEEVEYHRFVRLNKLYRDRFGFPFIIAVRDHDKAGILAAFERRLFHNRGLELAEALKNIARIAELRLLDLVSDGAAAEDAA